jgi:threonine 3-dehydrogenase
VLRKAGTFVVIGLPSRPIQLEINTNVMYKETKIVGITGREMYETWHQVLGLIRSKRVTLEKVITHQLAPEDFEKGFKIAEEAQDGKVEFIFG